MAVSSKQFRFRGGVKNYLEIVGQEIDMSDGAFDRFEFRVSTEDFLRQSN